MIKIVLLSIIVLFMSSCDNQTVEKTKVFGSKLFNSNEWKSSDISNKSKMIYSFLKTNNIKNMSKVEINQLLGESTAYYEYDEFPAYRLILNNVDYIIAFPINRETGKIRTYVLQPELNI